MSIIKDFVVKSGLVVQGTSATVSAITGALQVGGGAGIAGSVFVAGTSTFGATNPGTGSTSSVSLQTLQVKGGGLAVSGDSYFGNKVLVAGQTFITDGTNSVNTSSGALVVKGGLGIGADAWIGGQAWIGNALAITTSTISQYAVTYLQAGTDTAVSANLGSVTVWNTGTLQTITNRGAATTNAITISNGTQTTNTGSGALIVAGGAAIGAGLNVGGTIRTSANLDVGTTATFGSTTDATSINTASVVMQGGLAVAKAIYSLNHIITSANASVATVGLNALAVTAGGLGVAGTALIQGNTVLSATTNAVTTNSGQALLVAGGVGVGGNVAAGKVITVDATAATTGGAGSLQVAGGAYIANNLVVMSTSASTGTTSSNALYVQGGVGIGGSLLVGGNTTFSGVVTFNGTATYVYSTNTVYTDNLLELHTPPGGAGSTWSIDDGKDIGLRIHYYNGADQNAALVLANDSKMLEWYGSGVEDSTSTVKGAYGGFKTGYIQLATSTVATSAVTGALQVAGGIGVAGQSYFGGTSGTASTSSASGQGLVIAANGLGVTGGSYFANGLGIGGVGLSITNGATVGTVLKVSGGVGNATAADTQGILVTTGGIGVTGNSYFSGAVGFAGVTTVLNATNATALGTGALVLSAGGLSVNNDVRVGGTIYGAHTGVSTTATNLAGGALGSIPYQTASGATGYIGIGSSGFVLASNGTTATWQSLTTVPVGTATNAYNILVTATTVSASYNILYAGNNNGTFQTVYGDSGLTYNANTDVLTVGGTVDATSSATGALVVSGGVGVAKSVNIGGTLTNYGPHNILNSTNATSVSSGALTVTGGAGIGQNLYVGSSATVAGTITSTAIGGNVGVIVYTDVSGKLSTSTNFTIVGNTLTSPNVLINSNAISNSTSSGALIVQGGVGISGNTYVGGNLVVAGTSTLFSSYGVLYGNTWGFNALYSGIAGFTALPQVVAQFAANTSTYAQVNFQNINAGAQASTDYVLTADNGNDTSKFVDLGIASSNYNYPGYELIQANDGYLIVDGGNLNLGSQTAGKKVKIFAGSVNTGSATAIFSAAGTQATTTGTGALTVAGGASVWNNLYVGGSVVRTGNVSAAGWTTNGIGFAAPAASYTDTTLTGAQTGVAVHSLGIPTIVATGGTPTYANGATLWIDGAPVAGSGAAITSSYSMFVNAGNVKINAGTSNNSTSSGALQVVGGVGVGGSLTVGGTITAGNAATNSVVNGFVTNNALIATYSSTAISSTSTQNLDTFSTSTYRTAKYMVQLVDTGVAPPRVHATEMMIFHDGTNVFKSEYGITTSVGELGTFDATVTSGNVQLTFTPSWPSLTPVALVVKVYRTAITA